MHCWSARGSHSFASGFRNLYFTRSSVQVCLGHKVASLSRRSGVNNAPDEPAAGPTLGRGVCVCSFAVYHGCLRSTGMGDRPGNFSYLNPPHVDMRHLLPWLAHGYIRTRVRWVEPSCRTWERVHGGQSCQKVAHYVQALERMLSPDPLLVASAYCTVITSARVVLRWGTVSGISATLPHLMRT